MVHKFDGIVIKSSIPEPDSTYSLSADTGLAITQYPTTLTGWLYIIIVIVQ